MPPRGRPAASSAETPPGARQRTAPAQAQTPVQLGDQFAQADAEAERALHVEQIGAAHSAAAQGELRLYEGARAALRYYARITEGPHGS